MTGRDRELAGISHDGRCAIESVLSQSGTGAGLRGGLCGHRSENDRGLPSRVSGRGVNGALGDCGAADGYNKTEQGQQQRRQDYELQRGTAVFGTDSPSIPALPIRPAKPASA